jgi:hypothetical protein
MKAKEFTWGQEEAKPRREAGFLFSGQEIRDSVEDAVR